MTYEKCREAADLVALISAFAERELTAERARSAELESVRTTLHTACEGYEARIAALQAENDRMRPQLTAERAKREEAERWCQHVNGVLADTERELDAERARSAALQAEVERMKRDGCLSEHQLAIMKECGFDVALQDAALSQPAPEEVKP